MIVHDQKVTAGAIECSGCRWCKCVSLTTGTGCVYLQTLRRSSQ